MDSLIIRLGLALAIGLLVGLERGWRERETLDGGRAAGIRTYGASGLMGGVFGALGLALNAPSILIVGFLGFLTVFTMYKVREALETRDLSATGVIAGSIVFALGALAVVGDQTAAAAGGAALAVTCSPFSRQL